VLCYTEVVNIATGLVSIQERLDALQERIGKAANSSGRSAEAVTLIAVTKTVTLQAISDAYAAGVRDFGENRVLDLTQRAAAKQGVVGCRWHLIGHLQSNKARKAVRASSAIHSIDSVRVACLVGQEAAVLGRPIDVFAQVNLSGERSKSGLSPDGLRTCAGEMAAIPFVHWRGLMTIAPEAATRSELHTLFAATRKLRDELAVTFGAEWDALSMGMSNDFEVAIEEGATHVRVGRAIFGDRAALPTGGYL
jgi:pyridoxal phosphate enzyme (YggS family)